MMNDNKVIKVLLCIIFVVTIVSLLGMYLTLKVKYSTVVTTKIKTDSTTTLRPKENNLLDEVNQWKDSIDMINKEIEALTQQQPVSPRNAKGANEPILDIDFEPEDFPDLVGYEGVNFSTDLTRSAVSAELFEVNWENCIIKRAGGVDDYRLELTKEDKQASIFVFPVFEGKAYGNAMKLFEKKKALYQAKFQKLMQRKNGFENRYNTLRKQWEKEMRRIEGRVAESGRAF